MLSAILTKNFEFQKKPGWCGPAVINIILKSVGIKKTQSQIAKKVFKEWYGTSQGLLVAYLSKYFKKLNYKKNASISNIKKYLKNNYIVVVDWWDDLDDLPADGHYCIVLKLDHKFITLLDPSNSRNGKTKMSHFEFKNRWYDTVDVNKDKLWEDRWLMWVDPKSRIN